MFGETWLDNVSVLIDEDAATTVTSMKQFTQLAPPRRRYPLESGR
jgi:hypothetical protein